MKEKIYKVQYRYASPKYVIADSIKSIATLIDHPNEIITVELYDDCDGLDALQRHNKARSLNGKLIGE